jgi:hypothetical protein
MLRVGRDRMTDRGNVRGFEYVQCNAQYAAVPGCQLRPGDDRLRPAQRHRQGHAALREMLRVLRPGGQARVLEFSEVTADWFKPIYDFHSFKVLPKLGKLFAGDADSYQYLAESIRKHPPQEQLKAMMEAAGFARDASTRTSPAASSPRTPATGDRALVRIVDGLRPLLGPNDWICRQGGDEFLLGLHDDVRTLEVRLADWSAALVASDPLLRLSIGLAGYVPGEHAHALCRRADTAMYRAKRSGAGISMELPA